MRIRTIALLASIALLTACSDGDKTSTDASNNTESQNQAQDQSQAAANSGDKQPQQAAAERDPGVVNLYSYRKENLIRPLLDQFTEETGIQVNLISGAADGLIERLRNEGKNSPADILITVDVGRLHRAKTAGLLQPLDNSVLKQRIPAELRDSDDQWFGLSQRARIVFYNKDKVEPSELSTYEALADEQWKDRICVRSSDNVYNQSLLAAVLAHHDRETAKNWAAGIVENMAREPQGGDRSQLKAAAAGLCDLAISNTYYYGLMQAGNEADQEAAAQLEPFFPNQDSTGAHVNVSGAGLAKHAPNRDNAIKLLEFLVSDEAQHLYARVNYEYPVVEGVEPSDAVRAWGYPFTADDLQLSRLGELNAEAVKIFNEVGWR